MARRGDSSSIILLLICLIVLVGGVAAGYVAVDKKIIENPFASLLQEEPTAPTSEPLSLPATSTEETDFFMKENRPKPGDAPFISAVDEFNLTPGTTINCKRFPFPGDTIATLYMYVGDNNVKRYPNSDIAQSWGASSTSSTAISCRGLTKDVDMKGNWPTGTTVKCSTNDKVGSTDTLYYYINHGKLMKYESTGAIDYYDPNWRSTTKTIPDCSDYTLDSSYTIFDPRPPAVGGLMENASYKLKAGDRYCGGSSVVNFTCKDITAESAHTFQIKRDTTGAFPGYPYVIYNVTRGQYCRATDDSDDDGSYNFDCETVDANTPNTTGRSWERFNIELKSDGTYAIKSYLSGKYLRLYIHSQYDEMYSDAGSIGQATGFTFEPVDSSAAGSSMPADLKRIKEVPSGMAVACKAFPPRGDNISTVYTTSDANKIIYAEDNYTGKIADVNCLGVSQPPKVDCVGKYTDPPCPTACDTPANTVIKQWVTLKKPKGIGAAACPPSTESKSCPATNPCTETDTRYDENNYVYVYRDTDADGYSDSSELKVVWDGCVIQDCGFGSSSVCRSDPAAPFVKGDKQSGDPTGNDGARYQIKHTRPYGTPVHTVSCPPPPPPPPSRPPPPPPAVAASTINENTLYRLKTGDKYCGTLTFSDDIDCNFGFDSPDNHHKFQIKRDTTGSFSDYPYVIYNYTKNRYCQASDNGDDDSGRHWFECGINDANVPNDAGRTWERFNIESKGNNTFAIKSNKSKQYCRTHGNRWYSEVYCDRSSINDATAFTFDDTGETVSSPADAATAKATATISSATASIIKAINAYTAQASSVNCSNLEEFECNNYAQCRWSNREEECVNR